MVVDELVLTVSHPINKLPDCVHRVGRIWDKPDGTYEAVMTCGGGIEVSSAYCIKCGGYITPMLKNEITDCSREGSNLLKCDLPKDYFKRDRPSVGK